MNDKLKSSVYTRQSRNGGMLLDTDTLEYFRFNAVAFEVIDGLAKNQPLPTIIEKLCDRYEVSFAIASADAQSTIDQLATLGLLER